MKGYIESHVRRGEYGEEQLFPHRFRNVQGWTDHFIGEGIVFSHRDTDYVPETFRDALHTHAFYELVIWKSGDVRYILDDRRVDPTPDTVTVIPPNTVHSSQLLRPSRYERYVLYLSESAFASFASGPSVLLHVASPALVRMPSEEKELKLQRLLTRIEERLQKGGAGAELAALSSVIELLVLIGEAVSADPQNDGPADLRLLPEPVRVIRRYIEEHYDTITSVEEVAERFYYSREYVSRLFRRYYNLSPGEYVERCRIREARIRIAGGERIADVCYGVGYRSMSAFSAAFRRVTGKTPSSFRERDTKE